MDWLIEAAVTAWNWVADAFVFLVVEVLFFWW